MENIRVPRGRPKVQTKVSNLTGFQTTVVTFEVVYPSRKNFWVEIVENLKRFVKPPLHWREELLCLNFSCKEELSAHEANESRSITEYAQVAEDEDEYLDKSLGQKQALMNQTFANRRSLLENEELLFSNEVFSLFPLVSVSFLSNVKVLFKSKWTRPSSEAPLESVLFILNLNVNSFWSC